MHEVHFFDSKKYDQEYFTQLVGSNFNKYPFKLVFHDFKLNAHTVQAAKGAKAICAFVNDQVGKEVIEKLNAEDIHVLALRSAGYNNIDLKAAYNRLHVMRVPAYSPYSVAEHSLALMLTLNRKTHKAYYRTRENNFSLDGLMGFDLHGKTVGIVGTGKIGQIAGKILHGFGCRLLAYDPYPQKDFATQYDVNYVDLNTIYKESDVIALYCPLSSSTYHMINEEAVSQMKDGVMIINTGRGQLIKTSALIEGLKAKKIGSAGLDVYEEESQYFFEDYSQEVLTDDTLARLLSFGNVIVTSHQAFFTREALSKIAETTLDNLKDYFEGRPLKNEICYHCDKSDHCPKKWGKSCF